MLSVVLPALLVAQVVVLSACSKEEKPDDGAPTGQVEEPAGDGKPKTRIPMEWVRVPAGTFTMGSDRDGYEKPAHKVQITKDFWIGKYEVTFGQYVQFLRYLYKNDMAAYKKHKGWGTKTSFDNYEGMSDDQPVIMVNWHDAMAFCKWLSASSEVEITLPTEAQWEYACKAGSAEAFGLGPGGTQITDANLGDYAWYKANSAVDGKNQSHGVGTTKYPNKFGIYDMHGNVAEWVLDKYTEYMAEEQVDPCMRPEKVKKYVYRGGAAHYDAPFCTSSFRCDEYPVYRGFKVGFRVVAPVVEGK